MRKRDRKFHFTVKQIERIPAAPAKVKAVEYSDTEITGLKLAVGPDGKKRFFFRYLFKRRKCCMKLGEFPAMNLDAARQAAAKHRNMVTAGENPQLARTSIMQALSFAEFTEKEYIPYAKTHKKTWLQDEQRLANLSKKFGKYPLESITTHEIQKFLDAEKLRTSGTTANRILSLLHRMYVLAIQWKFVKENPCAGIQKNKEKARQRYLSNSELKTFLTELDKEANKELALALKFLLLTGCRRTEVLTLKWSQVDLDQKYFFLHETKNGEARRVCLNTMAIEVIQEMQNRKLPGNPYVFPSKSSSSGHFTEPKKLFHNVCQRSGIEDFRIHDLRHAFASLLVNNGVSLYEIKELLGHKDIKMTQRYTNIDNQVLHKATQIASDKLKEIISQ